MATISGWYTPKSHYHTAYTNGEKNESIVFWHSATLKQVVSLMLPCSGLSLGITCEAEPPSETLVAFGRMHDGAFPMLFAAGSAELLWESVGVWCKTNSDGPDAPELSPGG